MAKIACYVCGGKGGFKVDKKHHLDEGWCICPLCDSFGFIDEDIKESDVLNEPEFDNIKNQIENKFYHFAEVKGVVYNELGKDLIITLLPKNRKIWESFIRTALKFAHHSSRITIEPRQVFYFSDEEKYKAKWEIAISFVDLEDLRALLDVLDIYTPQYM